MFRQPSGRALTGVLISMLLACLIVSGPARAGGCPPCKKALVVVAFSGFSDKQYEKVTRAFKGAGLEVTIASSKAGTADGSGGTLVKVDKPLSEIQGSDYCLVFVIGGKGVEELYENKDAHRVSIEAKSAGALLGYSCWGPAVAPKEVCEGKKMAFTSGIDHRLKARGAIPDSSGIARDEYLFTSNSGGAGKIAEMMIKAIPERKCEPAKSEEEEADKAKSECKTPERVGTPPEGWPLTPCKCCDEDDQAAAGNPVGEAAFYTRPTPWPISEEADRRLDAVKSGKEKSGNKETQEGTPPAYESRRQVASRKCLEIKLFKDCKPGKCIESVNDGGCPETPRKPAGEGSPSEAIDQFGVKLCLNDIEAVLPPPPPLFVGDPAQEAKPGESDGSRTDSAKNKCEEAKRAMYAALTAYDEAEERVVDAEATLAELIRAGKKNSADLKRLTGILGNKKKKLKKAVAKKFSEMASTAQNADIAYRRAIRYVKEQLKAADKKLNKAKADLETARRKVRQDCAPVKPVVAEKITGPVRKKASPPAQKADTKSKKKKKKVKKAKKSKGKKTETASIRVQGIGRSKVYRYDLPPSRFETNDAQDVALALGVSLNGPGREGAKTDPALAKYRHNENMAAGKVAGGRVATAVINGTMIPARFAMGAINGIPASVTAIKIIKGKIKFKLVMEALAKMSESQEAKNMRELICLLEELLGPEYSVDIAVWSNHADTTTRILIYNQATGGYVAVVHNQPNLWDGKRKYTKSSYLSPDGGGTQPSLQVITGEVKK